MLAVLAAATGLLYIAITVARLVPAYQLKENNQNYFGARPNCLLF
jgi:hypothetical protein